MPKFLDIAKANTAKNLETCGILAGKLVRCQDFVDDGKGWFLFLFFCGKIFAGQVRLISHMIE